MNNKTMKDETKKVPTKMPLQSSEEVPVIIPDKTPKAKHEVKSKLNPKAKKTT